MAWIDSIVNWLSPERALMREVARRRLERLYQFRPAEKRGADIVEEQRSFESISGNRGRYDLLSTSYDADTIVANGAESLRKHVRQMEYNNGFISGPIRRIVDNVVGVGFRFQSQVRQEEEGEVELFPVITEKVAARFNSSAEYWYRIWAKRWADARLLMSFDKILSLVQASLLRDGEVLVIARRSERPGRPVPFCLEAVEIDRLSTPFDEIHNTRIRNGIEYDAEGAPKNYFVLKYHPGNTLSVVGRRATDYEVVPAFNPDGTRKIFHLFDPWRPEQTRGYTEFAAGLKDFQDLDRYMEAEKLAMLEDACLTGIVETPAPSAFQGAFAVDTDTDGNKIHEFSPGMWQYLRPGEKAGIHRSVRPNQAFGDIVTQLLRGPANALNIPPEVLAQDWHDISYSNGRIILLQLLIPTRIRQKMLIENFCEPVWENLLVDLIATGRVSAPGFDRRREAYLAARWTPPGQAWIDPAKEADGHRIGLENRFETLTEICAAKGTDIENVLETRARELKMMAELEEKHGIKFPDPAGAKAAATGGMVESAPAKKEKIGGEEE